mmetsp:Transcript_54794/g.118488  ORF Transcript_54794/g.118488 Transcript_54794/m.118488 type:complete len:209 (-) Transcript_54794:529-1155(-)
MPFNGSPDVPLLLALNSRRRSPANAVVVAALPPAIPLEVLDALLLDEGVELSWGPLFWLSVTSPPAASYLALVSVPAAFCAASTSAPASLPATFAAAAASAPALSKSRDLFGRGIPHSMLDALAEVSPQSQFGKGLHHLRPAATHAAVAPLGFHHDSAVQQAEELRSEALRSAVVGRPQGRTGVEFQELVLLEPLCKQGLHLTRVEHA